MVQPGKPFLFRWAVTLELAALIAWGMLAAAGLSWWFGVHKRLAERFARDAEGDEENVGGWQIELAG